MEKHNRKSHPLPTPNLASHAYNNDNNRASFLPLPKPETSPNNNTKPDADESSSITATPIIPEASSATCRLPMPISESEILSSPYLKAFSFDEIRKATANFSEDSLLGEGGFGCVFKGWLDVENPNCCKTRIRVGCRLRHPNVVKLIGFCIDGDDRILVYEFMPGGSLERHLFKRHSPSLSWARRIKVAVGAARAEFNAKLSDFGLAKAGPTESQTHVTTRVMGTEGYCDPRYLATGRLTVKCDVYSFGVVLLELLTGRRAIDETKCQEEKNLVNWVRLHVLDNGKVFRIMDTKLEGQYCKRSAYVAANIALRCVNHEPKYRPPMTYILEILENLPSNKNHHQH
ncbi:hypothetical protein DH2020_019463 [Rehmannia glutinosa]|uniref:Protein kinase domain-containing protein n=1 Tax=Rehmannia glutinosa TaxID=99300 RepID=A0ABR0WLW8_REHGL